MGGVDSSFGIYDKESDHAIEGVFDHSAVDWSISTGFIGSSSHLCENGIGSSITHLPAVASSLFKPFFKFVSIKFTGPDGFQHYSRLIAPVVKLLLRAKDMTSPGTLLTGRRKPNE